MRGPTLISAVEDLLPELSLLARQSDGLSARYGHEGCAQGAPVHTSQRDEFCHVVDQVSRVATMPGQSCCLYIAAGAHHPQLCDGLSWLP